MAAFPKLVLTSAGIALQTKVQGGATLELTNIQMGSGQLNGQPIGPLTALISSNATVPIQSGQAIGQNTYQVEGFFTNADLSAGFWWREIGIFANDPDNGEILYAYANADDAGDYIPTVTDQRIEKYIYFSMTLANATTVTVTIPQTDTYVLQSTVGQANGVAGLGGNGAVPVAQGGTGATTAQGAVVALGALFAIAAAGAYNPEESYAVGDYCTYKGKLRKCSTAIPTGEAWTEAHWTTTTVAAELAELSSQLSNKLSVTDHGSNSTSLLDTSLSEGIHICSNWTDCPPGLTDAQGTCISTPFLRFGDPVKYWGYRIYLPINDQKIYINRCANSVWDGWEAIATATPPQEFDLPLAEGLSAVSSAYWKDQFGVVTGHFNVLASSPQTGSSPVIATLPEGFRPSRQANATAVVSSGESLGLLVRQTGEIQLQDAASVTLEGKYIKGLFSFVAAS